MKKMMIMLTMTVVLTGLAQAGFDAYVIRNGASGAPTIQANNAYVAGATEFITNETSMKAGWGSNDINGATIADITQVAITRWDDPARYEPGSGQYVAPYFNIWVTDGNGNYATLANQPSRPEFQPLFEVNGDGSRTYDLSFADLANMSVQVYETPNGGYGSTTTWVHDLFGAHELTFAEVASLVIAPPPASYIEIIENAVGPGAADEIVTNTAWGFNWVFGDTLSNYVTDGTGYIVSDPIAAAVPEPATLALLGLGALVLRKRK